MTPKSLFIIILRVIGLFFLIDLIRVIPELLSTLRLSLNADTASLMAGLIFSGLLILLYFYLIRFILFRADKVVDKLSLDKGFSEEKFELNIHRSTAIQIAIIIIGGVILVQYLVPLVLDTFVFIQSKTSPDADETVSRMTLVRDIIMVLIGFFLVTNSRTITNWVDLKRRK